MTATLPIHKTHDQRISLLGRRLMLLAGVRERNLTVARNAAGIPEIRVPDSHPKRGRDDYFRPIVRIITNGPDAQEPTNLVALATLLASAPDLVEELGTALEDTIAEIEELHEEVANSGDLPIADEEALQAELRKQLWLFREDLNAQAHRAMEVVRKYLPPPQIIERERVVPLIRAVLKDDEVGALYDGLRSLSYLSPEQVTEIANTAINSLNLVAQEG